MGIEEGEFLFLGTGGSAGSPVIGCHCDVCDSHDLHNRRLRPSGFVRWKGKNILIDTGPDLREQLLREEIDHIDGVILTHTHYDHIGGMDDLRIFFFRQKQPLPCLLSKSSLKDLKSRLSYMFLPRAHGSSFSVQLDFQVLGDSVGSTEFTGLPIKYMTYRQGGMLVNGYRFGNFAYVSDICDYSDDLFDELKGVDTLVLSALRHDPSHVHLTVTEAVAFAQRVGARQTWLTHLGHELDHQATNRDLPREVQLAYDGLHFKFR